MEYEDMKERLSVLRTVNMPAERERDITSVLQNEMEKYNKHSQRRLWGSRLRSQLGIIGSASAAIVICAIGVGVALQHGDGHAGSLPSRSTTAAHGHGGPSQGQGMHQGPGPSLNQVANQTQGPEQSQNAVQSQIPSQSQKANQSQNSNPDHSQMEAITAPIKYTAAQLQNVKQTAQAVGVTASIPYQGLTGDTLTIVKNGGPGNLILDYKNIWVIESTSPIGQPSGITSVINTTVGGTPVTYMAGPQNSFLSFQSGGTYLMIENLTPGNPISERNMLAIGGSFKTVK